MDVTSEPRPHRTKATNTPDPEPQPPAAASTEAIGREIRQALTDAGRSQAWLAEALDVSTASVSDWARGEVTPSIPRVMEIEHHLGLPLGQILTRAGVVAPPGAHTTLEAIGKDRDLDSEARRAVVRAYDRHREASELRERIRRQQARLEHLRAQGDRLKQEEDQAYAALIGADDADTLPDESLERLNTRTVKAAHAYQATLRTRAQVSESIRLTQEELDRLVEPHKAIIPQAVDVLAQMISDANES